MTKGQHKIVNDKFKSVRPDFCSSPTCRRECWVSYIATGRNNKAKTFRRLLKRNHNNCRAIKDELRFFEDHIDLKDNNCLVRIRMTVLDKQATESCLLDSGSMASCFPFELAERLGIAQFGKPKFRLTGASGTALGYVGNAQIKIRLAGNEAQIDACIVRNPIHIIGVDALRIFNAIIDFGRAIVSSRLTNGLRSTSELPQENKQKVVNFIRDTLDNSEEENNWGFPVLPTVYCLVLVRGSDYNKDVYHYRLALNDGGEIDLNELQYCELVIYCCECDNCDDRPVCDCIHRVTATAFINRGQVMLDREAANFPFDENSVLRGYIYEPPPTLEVNLLSGVPPSVTMTDDGDFLVEPGHIEGSVSSVFTPGDPIDRKLLSKKALCLQCEAFNPLYHLCDFEYEKCTRLLTTKQLAYPGTIYWADIETGPVTNDHPELTILPEELFNDLTLPVIIDDSGDIIGEVELTDEAPVTRIFINNIERYPTLLNVVRCVNYLTATGHQKINIQGLAEASIERSDIDKLFTNVTLILRPMSTMYQKVVKELSARDKLSQGDHHSQVSTEEGELLASMNYGGPPEFRKRMEDIAIELDKPDGYQKPFFAKTGLDIGQYVSRKPPHAPIILNFPFKPGPHPFRPQKPRLCPESLQESARQHLDMMERAGIVAARYSPIQAPSTWLRKPNVEVTLEDWVKSGNKPGDFVAGMSGTRSGGLRFVSDLVYCSSMCYPVPYYQLHIVQQIRAIDSRTRYLTICDITAAFFHLTLGRRSSMACGFNPGVRGRGIYVYARCPMGHASSATALMNSMQEVLNGQDRVLQYSDNLLALHYDIEDAFRMVKLMCFSLKKSGWKARMSKCSWMWSGTVRIFGHEIDLENGEIRPNSERLAALAAIKTITSLVQLQKYLGIYNFMAYMIPPLSDSLAIIREPLGGPRFIWTQKHQDALEVLSKILSHPEACYVYLPSPNLPIQMACDSSKVKSCAIVYQMQKIEKKILGPYVLAYLYKSWNHSPEFQSGGSSAQRELWGLLFGIRKLEEEFPSATQERHVVTDALACGLLNFGAKVNSKLANDRLYISSIPNLKLCWTKSSDLALSAADFFTRDGTDLDPKHKKKNIPLKELDEIYVKSKVDKLEKFTEPRPAARVNYDISYLFEIPDSITEKCDDHSIRIDHEQNKVSAKVNGVEIELESGLPPIPVTPPPHVPHGIGVSMDGVLRVHRLMKQGRIQLPTVEDDLRILTTKEINKIKKARSKESPLDTLVGEDAEVNLSDFLEPGLLPAGPPEQLACREDQNMDSNSDMPDTRVSQETSVDDYTAPENTEEQSRPTDKIACESDVCALPQLEPEEKLDAADPPLMEPERQKTPVGEELECSEVRFIDWSNYEQTTDARPDTPVCYQTVKECQLSVPNHDAILNKHIQLEREITADPDLYPDVGDNKPKLSFMEIVRVRNPEGIKQNFKPPLGVMSLEKAEDCPLHQLPSIEDSVGSAGASRGLYTPPSTEPPSVSSELSPTNIRGGDSVPEVQPIVANLGDCQFGSEDFRSPGQGEPGAEPLCVNSVTSGEIGPLHDVNQCIDAPVKTFQAVESDPETCARHEPGQVKGEIDSIDKLAQTSDSKLGRTRRENWKAVQKTISRILSTNLVGGDSATNLDGEGSEYETRPPVNMVQARKRVADEGAPAKPAVKFSVERGTELPHVPDSECTGVRPIVGNGKFSAPRLPSNRERTIRCDSDAPVVILPREEKLPAAQDRSLPLSGLPQHLGLKEGDGGSCKSQVGKSEGNRESRPGSQRKIANCVLVKDGVPAPSPTRIYSDNSNADLPSSSFETDVGPKVKVRTLRILDMESSGAGSHIPNRDESNHANRPNVMVRTDRRSEPGEVNQELTSTYDIVKELCKREEFKKLRQQMVRMNQVKMVGITTRRGRIREEIRRKEDKEEEERIERLTIPGSIQLDAALPPSEETEQIKPTWYDQEAEDILMAARGKFPDLAKDILSLLCPTVGPEIRDPHANYVIADPKTPFERYWNYLLKASPLLDLPLFNQITSKDAFFKHIYKDCIQAVVIKKEKKYFLFKGTLICELRNTEPFKSKFRLVVPCTLSGDLITQTHRCFGHQGPVKLKRMLSNRFEINNLYSLAQMIFCRICDEIRPVPHGQQTVPRPKFTEVVRLPGFCYYADELVLATDGPNSYKILMLVDVYSHYCIPALLEKPLTSEYFLELLDTHVYKPLGTPYYIVTDGDRKISSKEIKFHCGVVGLQHVTGVRYRPTAQLAELYNQLLLRCVRYIFATENAGMRDLKGIVSRAAMIINTSPFKSSPDICPFTLFHPTKVPNFPSVGISLDTVKMAGKGPVKDLRNQLKLAQFLHMCRNRMLDARRYVTNKSCHENATDQIQAGTMVKVRNFRHYNRTGIGHKLLSSYTGDYIVRYRTGSTVIVAPATPFQGLDKMPAVPLLRTHVSDCKLVRQAMHFPDDPRHGKYLLDFYEDHDLPETKIITYETGSQEPILTTWRELPQEIDEEEEGELQAHRKYYGEEENDEVTETDEMDPELIAVIRHHKLETNQYLHNEWASNRKRMMAIRRMSKNVKNINRVRFEASADLLQFNEHLPTNKILGREGKRINRVTFDNEIIRYHLRCPNTNYASNHRADRLELNEEPSLLCREFINNRGINTRCTCQPCKIGSNRCKIYSCKECTNKVKTVSNPTQHGVAGLEVSNDLEENLVLINTIGRKPDFQKDP